MAINPKFILKNPETHNETSIKFYFYLNKRRFMYSLGSDQRIFPELWDKVTMRPITKPNKTMLSKYKKLNPSIEVDLKNLDTRINNVIGQTTKFISNAEIQGHMIDLKALREHLDNSFGVIKKGTKASYDSVEAYLDEFISDIESGKRIIKSNQREGKRYSIGTIKAYKVLAAKLEEYRKTKRKAYLKFNDIDIDFYNDFQQYIYSKNFSTNYFGNFIKNIKAIMKKSFDEGLHTNNDFSKKAFKKISNDTDSIYLTEAELTKLQNYDFKNAPKLEKYRDIFLVGCWTAQRFSDYSRISEIHIKDKNGIKVLEMDQVKTSTKVIVPLNPEAIEILAKYNNTLPKVSEQKMNSNLKEMGKLLDINETIEIKKSKGGLEIIEQIPKHDLIMSHTARRTGCTLMYLSGIPLQDIMKISGHKSETQLLKYIKVTKEETALRLADNPFFSGKKLKVV